MDPSPLEAFRERLVRQAARVLGDGAEAEDVAQVTILRAQAEAREARSLAAWLHAVCARVAVDRLRARRREARALEARAAGEPPEGAREGPAGEAESREERARAVAALGALDEPYRSALRLRYLEGLDFPEVARRLDTIERTARTWVGRGLAKLRERLGAGRDDAG